MTEYPPPPPGSYPPPPPPGYFAPGVGYPTNTPTGTNGLAIASLVCSVVGLLCGIGSIVGIVLGVIALGQIKKTGQQGRGLAIAGIAVGGVFILIGVIVAASMVATSG